MSVSRSTPKLEQAYIISKAKSHKQHKNATQNQPPLTTKTKKRILYNSQAVPYISYADIIWTNRSDKNIRKLQLAQNFAAKSMLGANKYSSSTAALEKLEHIPIQ